MPDHEKNTMTKLTIYALIAAFTFTSSVLSASDEPMAAELSEEQQVLAVQQEWVDAEVAGDEAILNRVLDERFLVNSSSGTPGTKESVIASVLGWNLVSQTLTDQTVLVDGDTAIIMGTAHFTVAVEGEENAISASRYITTYIKRDGRWCALALQMISIQSE